MSLQCSDAECIVCFSYSGCNVYKEAVVCEARRAGPVVSGLKDRVEELLVEWPEHPGLCQVSLHVTYSTKFSHTVRTSLALML